MTASGDVNFDSGTLFVDASADAVGIGTVSPSSKAHVKGDLRIEDATDTSTRDYIFEVEAATGDFTLSDSVSGERLRVDFNGNVGIGTANPATLLHLEGGSASPELRLAAASLTSNLAQFKLDVSNSRVVTASSSLYALAFDVNSAERLRIDSSGNVGIGTASPASKLNVSGGNVTVSAGYGIAFSGDQDRIITPEDNVSGALIKWSGVGICRFLAGSTEAMRIDASGNLGLGVTPSAWNATYSAFQNGGFVIATDGTNNDFSANRYVNSSGTSTYIANGYASMMRQVNGAFNWFTAPSGTAGNAISFTQAMTLDANGNLGVGTASPARTLHVNDVMRLEPRATAPSSPSAGDIFFNSSTNKLQCYDGTAWQDCF